MTRDETMTAVMTKAPGAREMLREWMADHPDDMSMRWAGEHLAMASPEEDVVLSEISNGDVVMLAWTAEQARKHIRDRSGRWARKFGVDFNDIGPAISDAAANRTNLMENWYEAHDDGFHQAKSAQAMADRLVEDFQFDAIWRMWSAQELTPVFEPESQHFDPVWQVPSPFDSPEVGESHPITMRWFPDGEFADGEALRQGLRQDKEKFAFAMANNLIEQWNITSNGTSALSLIMQQQVERMFSTGPVWHSDTEKEITDKYIDSAILAEPTVQSVMRAMYEETQHQLRLLGFRSGDRIRLYRGMHVAGSEGVVERPEGTTMGMQLRAASSWTTNHATALNYSIYWSRKKNPDNHSLLLSADVPVNRILSTPITGGGLMDHTEVIVLGGGLQRTSVEVDPEIDEDV